MSACPRILALVTIVLGLGGCMAVAATDVSKPSLGPGVSHRLNADGSVDLARVNVAAFPLNEGATRALIGPVVPIIPLWSAGPERRTNGFVVSVRIDPEGETVEFDPRAVRLKTPDAPSIAPVAVSAPYAASVNPVNRVTLECWTPSIPIAAIAGAIAIRQLACVALRFDIPTPPPDRAFEVTIAGLTDAGQPLPALTVRFTKGQQWFVGSPF